MSDAMFMFFPFVIIFIVTIAVIYKVYKEGYTAVSRKKLAKSNEFINKNRDKVSEIFDKKYGELKPLKNKIWYAIILLVVCIILSIVIRNKYFAFVSIGVSMLLVAIACWSYSNDSTKKFLEISKEILHDFDPDIEYKPGSGFSSSEYALCRFPERCDRFHSEDMIINLKKGFHYADVLVESEHEDKDGNTSYYTEYEGSLAKMYIKDVGCKIYLGGMKTNWFVKDNNYVKIKFENDEFNDLFKAYADNELQAYKILTPDVMEEFVKIKKYSFGDVDIRILDNRLYIRFLSGNGFDNSGIGKESDKENLCQSIAVLEEVIKIMEKVKKIIDNKNMD